MVWEFMGLISHSRGHKIYYDGSDWRHVDNNELIDQNRPCKKCGLKPIKLSSDMGDDVDACLGILEGVKSACCGHGVEDGYIVYEDGRREIIKR